MRGALFLALLMTRVAAAEPQRFALIVGNNLPLPGSEYEPLRYADDDALRFAHLMRGLGARVELLVSPDAETLERFGDRAEGARPPKRAAVLAALDRLEAALEASEGPREVYVYFSGHGSVNGSNAYLHLLDAPFHRADLHALVLDRLPRERLHVIIDSCHAYFLVNARGRVRARPEVEDLARYPDAGFLLSTSDRREVHEWAGYRGGVFSYQVIGALHGAADVDADGVISYPEAHAYVVAANMAVENPRARIRPFVRSPAGRRAPLLDLRDRRRAAVPAEATGRLRVYDAHGYPHLDAHRGSGPLALLPPGPRATLRAGATRYRLDPGGDHFTRADPTGPDAVAARGDLDDDFRRNLFRRPLTRDFVAGFEAAARDLSAPAVAAPRGAFEDPLTLSLGAVGVSGLVAGGVFTGLFLDARDAADARPVTHATEDARGRAERWRAAMWLSYGIGVASLGAAVLNGSLGRTEDASISWGLTPGGLGIAGGF